MVKTSVFPEFLSIVKEPNAANCNDWSPWNIDSKVGAAPPPLPAAPNVVEVVVERKIKEPDELTYNPYEVSPNGLDVCVTSNLNNPPFKFMFLGLE
jgi:hypothetical protein